MKITCKDPGGTRVILNDLTTSEAQKRYELSKVMWPLLGRARSGRQVS